jgi:hypothetical protein
VRFAACEQDTLLAAQAAQFRFQFGKASLGLLPQQAFLLGAALLLFTPPTLLFGVALRFLTASAFAFNSRLQRLTQLHIAHKAITLGVVYA